jgi:hypothetical protein
MAVNLFLDIDVTLSDALESQTQTQIDGSRIVRNLGNISDSNFLSKKPAVLQNLSGHRNVDLYDPS